MNFSVNSIPKKNDKTLAVISTAKFPGKSGDTTNYLEIINQLIKENIHVVLICPKNPEYKEKDDVILPEVEIIRIPYIIPPRLAEMKNGMSLTLFFRFLIFQIILQITVFGVLKRKRIKHVFLRNGILTLSLPPILRVLKIKSMADGELYSDSFSYLPDIVTKLLRYYERRMIKVYTNFKTSTKHESLRLIKNGYPDKRIVLIPVSVNIEKVPYFQISDIPSNTFGYFGGLEEWQGLVTLLQAFKIVVENIPNSLLYIIGDGSMKETLTNFVDSNNLTENVVFVGSKPREEVWNEYFKKFRIVVIPRQKMNNSLDLLLPIKLIESISAGKPAITTDIPAMNEIPKDVISIVPSKDYLSLAKEMESLSSDERKLHLRSIAAREYAQTYDIKRNIKKFTDTIFN